MGTKDMEVIEIIGDIETDGDGEKWIMIKIANKAVKKIKSCAAAYEGDEGNALGTAILNSTKADIHEVWKLLNPS